MATITAPFKTADQEKTTPNGAAPAACKPEVITITPDLARDWTLLNTRNRPVRYTKVARYARDMKARNWAFNGETIKIATDGTIIDGQHRLYACIQADTPFDTIVIRGLPLEVQDTVDTGSVRTMSDQFGLHGEPNANLLAAITRWSFKWLRGVRVRSGHDQEPTHSEMIALLEAEPRLREAAAWAERARRVREVPVTGSVWGMAWMLFHGANHLAAEVFLDKCLTGADCPAGHPALAFRSRMLTAKAEGQRLNQNEQLGYMIMAWNAFRDERTLVKLLPPRGGFTPKTFPEPK